MLHPSSFEVLSTGVKVALFAADWVLCDLVVVDVLLPVVVEVDALVPLVVDVDALVPVVVEVTVSKEANPGDST